MKEKNELVKECTEIIQRPSVIVWYDKNMKDAPQYDTIKTLMKAIRRNDLTLEEALSILLIVGIQWNVKFDGVK
jgi:hypothetical protein